MSKNMNERVHHDITLALDPQTELSIRASSSPENTFPCTNKS